ncbi:MAG: inosamine-phosphate amidinotransferase 1 [Verrucomicrobiota bacterium]
METFGKEKEKQLTTTSIVCTHNEWDTLEEIIIGRADFAQLPRDLGIDALSQATPDIYNDMAERHFPERIVEETEEDLSILVTELEKLDIRVRRPTPIEFDETIKTPFWESGYFFTYCPRDVLLSIGDMIIETPNVFRSRFFEAWAYKDILVEYLQKGARWISAPPPALRDEVYNFDQKAGSAINNTEPLFDAANVIKAGKDIFYLVSDSGNELGLKWLQATLGSEYRVHACRNLYSSAHIDTTLVLLRPGLLLANPERVNEDNLPEPLKGWDIMFAPEMVEPHYSDLTPMASKWFGMNVLMLSPSLAVVDQHQTALVKQLESAGIEVLPLRLRHGRQLGGGFHCVTMDVRRNGSLQSYF